MSQIKNKRAARRVWDMRVLDAADEDPQDCLSHEPDPAIHHQMGESVWCDGSCRDHTRAPAAAEAYASLPESVRVEIGVRP